MKGKDNKREEEENKRVLWQVFWFEKALVVTVVRSYIVLVEVVLRAVFGSY